jgi:hypothetical protein
MSTIGHGYVVTYCRGRLEGLEAPAAEYYVQSTLTHHLPHLPPLHQVERYAEAILVCNVTTSTLCEAWVTPSQRDLDLWLPGAIS